MQMISSLPQSPDPTRLAPEDAIAYSPPHERKPRTIANGFAIEGGVNAGLSSSTLRKDSRSVSSKPRRSRGRSRSNRRTEPKQWKKLLWIEQPYPDNYTDPSTFLSHLQLNPRIQAYDFWPLVADSTTIVQHICAVALFVCCFIAIYQERISPVSVVGTATACSVVGWIMWDTWLGADEQEKERAKSTVVAPEGGKASPPSEAQGDQSVNPSLPASTVSTPGLGITSPASYPGGSLPASKLHSRNASYTSLASLVNWPAAAGGPTSMPLTLPPMANIQQQLQHVPPYPTRGVLSPRNQQRLATAKSALLIYLALLGLSPILKSLTQSTSSDSIWAMSFWLLLTNIFTFDYGGGGGAGGGRGGRQNGVVAASATSTSPSARFPASLSTNAALMASTVLASRLPTTTHVFSLTLFSIEVFGLFPVFRRHLRHRSFALHVVLTVLLILVTGAALGATIIAGGVVKATLMGMAVWGLGAIVGMGGCSWWLIGLQRYKSVVIGPWDPARPIIRAGAWD